MTLVKFTNPLPDEDPMERYVVIDASELTAERVSIIPLSLAGWPVPPVLRVNTSDLTLVS